MAKIRAVTRNKVSLTVETSRRIKTAAGNTEQVREKIRKDFSKWHGRALSDLVGDYYKEVFVAAQRITAGGMPGAAQDGVQATDTQYGKVSLGFWAALGFKYRKQKAFENPGTEDRWWTKRGFLKQSGPLPNSRTGEPRKMPKLSRPSTTATIGKASRQLSSGTRGNPGTLRDVKVSDKRNNLGQVPLTAKIGLKSSGEPVLDFIASRSFIAGKPVWSFMGSPKVEGASEAGIVIAATDQRRPLISRLAAALGQRAVIALSNMKI